MKLLNIRSNRMHRAFYFTDYLLACPDGFVAIHKYPVPDSLVHLLRFGSIILLFFNLKYIQYVTR